MDEALLDNTLHYLREKAVYLIDPDHAASTDTLYASRRKKLLFMPGFSEIETIASLLPQLLTELEHETAVHPKKYRAYSPSKARPSRKPSDYWYVEQKLIPKLWNRSGLVINTKIYAWLSGLLAHRLVPYLENTFKEFGVYEQEIKANREGFSHYARSDEASLGDYFKRIERTLLIMKKNIHFIQNQVTDQVLLSHAPPDPIPSSPAWAYALEMIKRWYKPEQYAKNNIHDILSAPVQVASLPFLYQRYVGLRLAESLQRCGWEKIAGNELIACFVGGSVQFVKGFEKLSVWYEPRLSKNHPSGFTSTHNNDNLEQTPDYLLVKNSNPDWLEGYVLDATLQYSEDGLRQKTAKYLGSDSNGQNKGIQQQKMVSIAGCKAIRRPVRSWVISPNLLHDNNQLLSQDGIFGAIQVNPRRYSSTALDLFIQEIA